MVVFIVCACVILYVLAGYPLLLGWLSSRRAPPAVYRSELKTVTVLLAVHNGARFLEQKLDSIAALDYPPELVNVVVISDGSTDETDAIAEGRKDRRVELIRVPRAGKAAALNAGIARATGEILLFTDVRQRLDPASLRLLIECFADPTVGAASGELILMESQTAEQRDVGLYRRYESWIRMRLSRLDSIFGATGCLYAMRRELAVPMPTDTLLDDVYLPIHAFFRGYRLIFEERARAFDFPTTLDVEFRRKVRTLAGNYQIMRAFPALLGLRNRLWIHFVSYKLGRLLLPWLLLGLAVSSFWLPQPVARLALVAQGFFYLVAALDLVVPARSGLKKLSSPARTFVVLVLAAACASVVFFVPPQTLWKETKVA
jgi:cellulose synthase/poly-beta-1,6-N-acetylglucosamine synthase-like glycosyltransferase